MSKGWIVAGVVAAILASGAMGIGYYGVPWQPEGDRPLGQTGAESVSVPPADTPYLRGLGGAPLSAGIYQGRVLEQSDLAGREQRIRQLAFRIRSEGVNHDTISGDDRLSPVRSASAVPLGIQQDATGRRSLVLLTTRCVVDRRYPTMVPGQPDNEDTSNYALLTDGRGGPEVFALAGGAIPDRPELTTTCMCDSGHPHMTAAQWTRYSTQLGAAVVVNQPSGGMPVTSRQPPTVPLVRASLIDGAWNSNQNTDLALLFVPLDDPGSVSLVPADNLGLSDPQGAIRSVIDGRSNIWGSVFQFSLVSDQCMRVITDNAAEMRRQNEMYKTVAIASVAVTLVVLVGTTVGLPAIVVEIGRAAVTAAGPAALAAARDAIIQTVVRAASGEQIQSVLWDQAGNLVVSVLRPDGIAGRFAVAGLRRAGLSDSQAQRVIELVTAFAQRQSAQLVETTTSRGQNVMSIMDPPNQTDLSAELLRRGLVRLAVDDVPQLAQHRRLIDAAQLALTDPTTRDIPLLQDATYQHQVIQLSEQPR